MYFDRTSRKRRSVCTASVSTAVHLIEGGTNCVDALFFGVVT